MKKTNNNQALVFENDLEILGYTEHLLGTMDGVEWAVRRHSMGTFADMSEWTAFLLSTMKRSFPAMAVLLTKETVFLDTLLMGTGLDLIAPMQGTGRHGFKEVFIEISGMSWDKSEALSNS